MIQGDFMETITLQYSTFLKLLWSYYTCIAFVACMIIILLRHIIKGWPYRGIMKEFKQISREEHRNPIDQEYLIIEKFVEEYEREQIKKCSFSKEQSYEDWKAARERE